MPVKSAKQKRYFQACQSPKFRKKVKRGGKKCPPLKVIKEFLGKG
jgi:hypothetical protein